MSETLIGKRHVGSTLTGEERCVLCNTLHLEDEHEQVVKSPSGDFICPGCLYGKDKSWKYTMFPNPAAGEGSMVTDDFENIKDWVENDESCDGYTTILVNWGYENLERFIERKLEESTNE